VPAAGANPGAGGGARLDQAKKDARDDEDATNAGRDGGPADLQPLGSAVAQFPFLRAVAPSSESTLENWDVGTSGVKMSVREMQDELDPNVAELADMKWFDELAPRVAAQTASTADLREVCQVMIWCQKDAARQTP